MPTTATTKPFLTYQQQLDLLKTRGLIVHDEPQALLTLKDINYYRLSAYSLTLRKHDIFYTGVTFDDIVNLYNFDDRLRRIVLRFSFAVEHSISAYLAYKHANNHGPLGYLNNQYFRDEKHHAAFINRLFQKLERSAEPAIVHHRNDLGGVYPFWVAIEAMSFDMISLFFKNMKTSDKKDISGNYYGDRGLYYHVENWLHCCVNIRNIAAHGARFYNRILPAKVRYKIGDGGKFRSDSPFANFYAMFMLLPTAEQKTAFVNFLSHLFNEYPKANIDKLGFPNDWENILVI